MNYVILIWEIIFTLIICILTSFIYLVFEYNEKKFLHKLFVPKNDSIWEHIKIILAPSLLFVIIESIFFKVTPNFMLGKLFSLLFIILTNPILFLILFKNSKWDMVKINIVNTVSSLLIGLLVSIFFLSINNLSNSIIYISLLGLIMIFIFYIIATFFPTNDLIFLDPITKKNKVKKDL